MESVAAEYRLVVRPGYAEHAPPRDLAPFVACFWTRRADESLPPEPRYRVLPDGCADIVLGFGGIPEVADGDVDGAVVVGTMTRPLIFHGHAARLYAGVRFRPGHAFAALGIPAEEVTDQRVSLIDLALRAEDVERVLAHEADDARLQALVRFVRRRLAKATSPPASVRAAIRRIAIAGGNLRVAALASELGVTRQHLARQFAVHAGVSPKMLACVARVRAAIERAGRGVVDRARRPDWSRIAHELGYFDQSHFIDDFKEIVGLTPGDWASQGTGTG